MNLFYVILLWAIKSTAYANLFTYPDELKETLVTALKSMPADYLPRTQHICSNQQPCYINRLILERSPYLLQHAHNPVDWHVWGKAALDKARRENKPIFLSVGYAACHWCHVMEKESFDTLEIARLLNKHFIAIKVDRERRPDIDEFYGNAMMYFQGQQGWPMSLFLTPDAKPFDGGGYFPLKKFKQLLVENAARWRDQQQQVLSDADKVMSRIYTGVKTNEQAATIDQHLRHRAIKDLLSIVDNYNGGFGEASKFPREPWLSLLLNDARNDVYGQQENNDALAAVNNTLLHIGQGGIYDQLAGGFHRYATDPYWKIPHFEKMLYNQALLMRLYLQANALKPNYFYTRLVDQTAKFLINEMMHPAGGFYSTLDADTEGEEGKYYLWHLKEWQEVLEAGSPWFAELYDVDDYGEIDDGKNVLYLAYSYEEFAKEKNISRTMLLEKIDQARQQLLNIRNKREKPAVDKKIIMGWNGLAISALAEAAKHLNKPEYLVAASRAADFIWTEMRKPGDIDGHFYRSQFKSENSQIAQLDDYAYYLQALISLYDTDKNRKWLNRAETISKIMLNLFWDKQQGGFFNVAEYADAPLPVRPKSAFDKTLPSGNTVAAHSLLRLSRRTGKDDYKHKSIAVLSAFAAEAQEVPSAFSGLLVVADEMQSGEKDLPVYAARGQLRVDADLKYIENNYYELQVELSINKNWHINSSKPLEKYLIPTLLTLSDQSGWQLDGVQYPKHDVVKLGFSKQPLALYQGLNQIRARLKKVQPEKTISGLNPVIHLQLQACDDRVCLPPEILVLYPHL
ncbi:MAG: thioredoxin domain-containing protein [Gammaproteobacteria bacterium]|nr:thioredoxin domain-containing protein [Gammaproteobacteria bacterium]